MGLDLTAANDVLKEHYYAPVVDLLNNKTLLLKRRRRNTEDFSGRLGYQPLRVGRNEGMGARGEGATLPTAGSQQYDYAYWNMTNQYLRIEVTGQVIAATKNNEGSFIEAVDSEIMGGAKDFARDLNRQLITGGLGKLANVTSGAVSGTIAKIAVDSTQYLRKGMKIDNLSATAGASATLSVDLNIFKISGLVTFLSADSSLATMSMPASGGFYRADSFANEMFGMADIMSESNPSIPANPNTSNTLGARAQFGNVDRSANGFWKATILSSGTDLTLEIMDEMRDTIDINGDGETSLIMCHHTQHRKYARLLTPDRRFPTADGQPIDLDGGYKALSYDNIPVVKERDYPTDVMDFQDESTLGIFVMQDFAWMDKDGSILNRVADKDKYEATMKAYWEQYCNDPPNNGRITSLAT
jgi:hypothetical protein